MLFKYLTPDLVGEMKELHSPLLCVSRWVEAEVKVLDVFWLSDFSYILFWGVHLFVLLL